MKFILSTSFLLTISLNIFASVTIEINNKNDLKDYLKQSPFNGVVFVKKQNEVLLKEAFGVKDITSGELLSTEDKFQIGSNSKQFVAASILKLQENRLLSLDDSISKYIPKFLKYPQITIRDVLNHTSGLTNYTDHPEFEKNIEYNRILTLDDIIDFALEYPLDFETKTDWKYSNTGFIVAGKIVELVSGVTWDKFIQENFLLPLEMDETGYVPYFSSISPVSAHYFYQNKLNKYDEFNLSWALSAGALYSTVEDMSKWLDIYSGTTNLLQKSSLKEMTTPFKGNYGLGVWIKSVDGDVEVTHTGRTPGFVSYTGILKNQNLKIITLDNSDGALSGVGDILLRFFTQGKTFALKTKTIEIDSNILKDYIGHFKSNSLEVDVFVKDGSLFLQPNDGQPAYLLSAVDVDSFTVEGFAGEEFIRDANAKVVKIKHFQNGGFSYFTKSSDILPQGLIKKKSRFLDKFKLYQRIFK